MPLSHVSEGMAAPMEGGEEYKKKGVQMNSAAEYLDPTLPLWLVSCFPVLFPCYSSFLLTLMLFARQLAQKTIFHYKWIQVVLSVFSLFMYYWQLSIVWGALISCQKKWGLSCSSGQPGGCCYECSCLLPQRLLWKSVAYLLLSLCGIHYAYSDKEFDCWI